MLRTPRQFGDSDLRCVDPNGEITYCGVHRGDYAGIRPAFYLNQGVNFKSGSGVADDPYSVRDEVIKIGEYLQMGTYYGEPILWRCVDIDENGPLMLSDKILSAKAIDASGTNLEAIDDNGTNIESSHRRGLARDSNGSNYWPDSNMRSWLNSQEYRVEWLCGNPPDKDHLDGGYNAYDQEPGFLTNFTQEEIDAINKVTQKFTLTMSDDSMATSECWEEHTYYTDINQVVANYDRTRSIEVEDRMFLPDVKQLYAVYENRGILGDDYYIGEPTAKCVENSEYKSNEIAVGKKWRYWIRTPKQFGYSDFRCVDPNGKITDGIVNHGNHAGIRPAFYLKLDAEFKPGLGTADNPYVIQDDVIKIGEYVQLGTYYGEPIMWRCVAIDENGPLMLADKILTIKAFDANGLNAVGSHGTNVNRRNQGSSYWPDSNMRSWLNSDADAGNVEWPCGNPPDAAHLKSPYNAYDKEAGFLHGFTRAELSAIKEVTLKTLLCEYDKARRSTGTEQYVGVTDIKDAMSNYDKAYAEYVADRIFLPDVKQAYEVYINGDILGDDYYIGEPTAACVERNEDKSNGLTFGGKWNYALRTPYTNSVSLYYVIADNGSISYTAAHTPTYAGMRPAFYLKESAVFKSGLGTVYYPYSMQEDNNRVPFGVENSIELNKTYGEVLTADLSKYIKYKNGADAAGRFAYEILYDGKIGASVSGDMLTIPKDAGAGEHTLIVRATEVAPVHTLASVDNYGFKPVMMEIKLKVAKAVPMATVRANELVTKNKDQYLVTGKTDDGTLMYRLGSKGNFSENVPTGNLPADYTVWYMVKGDKNHIDSEPQSIVASIKNIYRIRIESKPTNTTVIEGMPLDATGLVVTADCGEWDWYEAFGYTLSGYDTSKPGRQTVTVTYSNQTAQFPITVLEKSFTGIELTHAPDKLTYYQGDSIDTAGMVITAFYNNNTSDFINNDECTVSELTDAVGKQTVTVTYNGQSVEFTVNVLEKTASTGAVETPLIEIADFYGGKRAIISCATDGVEIYYTTDGTEPSTSSQKYTGPIELTETTEIKAIAVRAEASAGAASIESAEAEAALAEAPVSAVSSEPVKVEKVSAPEADVLSGEVAAGTEVKLTCATPGAEIYYTTGDSLNDENYIRYTDKIVITKDTTLHVMAAKRGCVTSEDVSFAYSATSDDPDAAVLMVDTAIGRADETFNLPVYVYADRNILDARVMIEYDSNKFEYVSFAPGVDVQHSEVSVVASNNTVTVRCAGYGISGETCLLEFKAKADVEKGDYDIPVREVDINTDSDGLTHIYYTDGLVTIVPAKTEITVSASFFVDSESNMIDDVSELKGDLTAWVTTELVNAPKEGETVKFDILIAFYGTNGNLVKTSKIDVEMSSDMDLIGANINIPENLEIGSVKLMIWDEMDTMRPLMETVQVLPLP